MNQQIKGAVKALGIVFAAFVCLWAWIGVRIGVWGARGYGGALTCFLGTYPLGADLWFGNVKAGDDMNELLKRVRPTCETRYGEWTEYTFKPGCERGEPGPDMGPRTFLLTRGSSLLRAEFGSCTFSRVFFDAMTETERAEWEKAAVDIMRPREEDRNNETRALDSD